MEGTQNGKWVFYITCSCSYFSILWFAFKWCSALMILNSLGGLLQSLYLCMCKHKSFLCSKSTEQAYLSYCIITIITAQNKAWLHHTEDLFIRHSSEHETLVSGWNVAMKCIPLCGHCLACHLGLSVCRKDLFFQCNKFIFLPFCAILRFWMTKIFSQVINSQNDHMIISWFYFHIINSQVQQIDRVVEVVEETLKG